MSTESDKKAVLYQLKQSYLAYVIQNAANNIMNMKIAEFKSFIAPKFIEFAKKKGFTDEDLKSINTSF